MLTFKNYCEDKQKDNPNNIEVFIDYKPRLENLLNEFVWKLQ